MSGGPLRVLEQRHGEVEGESDLAEDRGRALESGPGLRPITGKRTQPRAKASRLSLEKVRLHARWQPLDDGEHLVSPFGVAKLESRFDGCDVAFLDGVVTDVELVAGSEGAKRQQTGQRAAGVEPGVRGLAGSGDRQPSEAGMRGETGVVTGKRMGAAMARRVSQTAKISQNIGLERGKEKISFFPLRRSWKSVYCCA